MKISTINPPEKPIKELIGGEVFRHNNKFYMIGQGGVGSHRECIFLETGKNCPLGDNTLVEHYPKATLYLE